MQRYEDLRDFVFFLKSKLKNSKLQIQKIVSTSRYICIESYSSLYKNLILCMGRGHSYESLGHIDKMPPPFLRKKDIFLELLRANLINTYLVDIKIHDRHRIFCFQFQKFKKPLIM